MFRVKYPATACLDLQLEYVMRQLIQRHDLASVKQVVSGLLMIIGLHGNEVGVFVGQGPAVIDAAGHDEDRVVILNAPKVELQLGRWCIASDAKKIRYVLMGFKRKRVIARFWRYYFLTISYIRDVQVSR